MEQEMLTKQSGSDYTVIKARCYIIVDLSFHDRKSLTSTISKTTKYFKNTIVEQKLFRKKNSETEYLSDKPKHK